MRIFDRKRHASPEGYVAYQEHEDVRKLFRGLQPMLDPIDYDRIRWSGNWSSMLQEMGLLR